jgi:hypothetical protein
MPCSPGFLPGSAARGGTISIKYGSIRQYNYRPGKRTSRAGDGNRTRAISLGTGEATPNGHVRADASAAEVSA